MRLAIGLDSTRYSGIDFCLYTLYFHIQCLCSMNVASFFLFTWLSVHRRCIQIQHIYKQKNEKKTPRRRHLKNGDAK